MCTLCPEKYLKNICPIISTNLPEKGWTENKSIDFLYFYQHYMENEKQKTAKPLAVATLCITTNKSWEIPTENCIYHISSTKAYQHIA